VRILAALAVVLIVAGTALAAAPVGPSTLRAGDPMPDKDAYPFQNLMREWTCTKAKEGVDARGTVIGAWTPDTAGWPFPEAVFWYLLDGSQRESRPFLAAAWRLKDEDDRYFTDLNRDGKIDRVLTGDEVDKVYKDNVCNVVKEVR
jgi:hypothetical protein